MLYLVLVGLFSTLVNTNAFISHIHMTRSDICSVQYNIHTETANNNSGTPKKNRLLKALVQKMTFGTEERKGDDYSKMTVVQLKKKLSERGMKVSGLKSELQSRLHEDDLQSSGNSGSDFRDLDALDDFYDSLDFKKNSNVDIESQSEESLLFKEKEEQEPQYDIAQYSDDRAPYVSRPDWCTRGDKILVIIERYGPLGASVSIYPNTADVSVDGESWAQGLVLQDELNYYALLKGSEPLPGEQIEAYVLSIRDDGKINVSLRPVGYDKVAHARSQVLAVLENPESEGQVNVGDKSTPKEIWNTFPGLSKGQFKAAVGALLREGAITITKDTMTLVPERDRTPMPAKPYDGKSPQGFKVSPDGATLFMGNLDFGLDEMSLAQAIEFEIGHGHLARVKIATGDNGLSRGYAHVDFFSPKEANEAMDKLQGVSVWGRGLRLEHKKSLSERASSDTGRMGRNGKDNNEYGNRPIDWGASSSRGIRKLDGTYERDELKHNANMQVATVYLGNLPYEADENYLQDVLESRLSNKDGVYQGRRILEVRCAIERNTKKKRGFGYADIINETIAKQLCDELDGMMIMGRPLRVDFEGLKRGESRPMRSSDRGGGESRNRRSRGYGGSSDRNSELGSARRRSRR
jgi:RNA recognition motif-containing protein